METCFEYIDKEDAFFSSDERRWITRVRKLAERFPDKVTILKQPEENDGCIYARLPQEAMKINLISRPPLTDEQIATLRERAKQMQKVLQEVRKGDKHD